MLQHLVALLTAFVDLFEAEGQRLQLALRKVLVAGVVLAVVATVVGAGLIAASGFLLWAFYLALAAELSSALSALIVGLVAWLLLGGALWLIVRRTKAL